MDLKVPSCIDDGWESSKNAGVHSFSSSHLYRKAQGHPPSLTEAPWAKVFHGHMEMKTTKTCLGRSQGVSWTCENEYHKDLSRADTFIPVIPTNKEQ